MAVTDTPTGKGVATGNSLMAVIGLLSLTGVLAAALARPAVMWGYILALLMAGYVALTVWTVWEVRVRHRHIGAELMVSLVLAPLLPIMLMGVVMIVSAI